MDVVTAVRFLQTNQIHFYSLLAEELEWEVPVITMAFQMQVLGPVAIMVTLGMEAVMVKVDRHLRQVQVMAEAGAEVITAVGSTMKGVIMLTEALPF